MINDIKLAQGPAKPATAEDLERDATGITNPNLHRRIDDTPVEIKFGAYELGTQDGYTLTTQDGDILLINYIIPGSGSAPQRLLINNKYTLTVSGVNSYRTAERILHDEESTDSEVP